MKNITFLLCLFIILLVPFIAKGAIVINEVAWMGTTISSYDEWIELYNNGTEPVDLTGWVLGAVDGAPIINLTGTIQPNSYFLLERADDGSVPNIPADLIYGNNGTSWALNNNGENLNLKNNDGNIIDGVNNCEKGWCGGNNTTKQTMERVDTGWQTSLNPEGTPKAINSSGALEEPASTSEESSAETTTQQISANSQPPIADAGNNLIAFIDDEITFDGSKSHDPDGFDLAYEWNLGEGGVKNDVIVAHKYSYPGTYLVTLTVFDGRYYSSDTITVEIYPKKITINEFLPSPIGKDGEEEWIELYNDSDQIIDISGWQLDDEDGGSEAFVFPENTLIAPKNYLVFSRPTTKIALNNDEGKVRLLLSTGVIFQEIAYEKAPQEQSSARTPEGFVWSMPTPGLPNIIGLGNKQVSYNQTFQSETTGYPSENLAINYQSDKNQINGGWAYLPQQNSQEKFSGNLLTNLEQNSEKINYKLILIVTIIIIAGLIIGIIAAKLKKKL